ncbi:MAG: hypothetical protein NTZ09_09005 [Candidatus Hydrogenedentes bacterium]|nr:hypothetical protein [Candidatus Hydrogenedentota bacterium]
MEHSGKRGPTEFYNEDALLEQRAGLVLEERRRAGLGGLVGGLAAIVIGVEREQIEAAAAELLRTTGYVFDTAFEDSGVQWCVLKRRGSADIILQARKTGANPFLKFSDFPKVRALPNTRLETFVFETPDLAAYLEIQRGRGLGFDGEIARHDNFLMVQTAPLELTGISYGFIEWTGERGQYSGRDTQPLPWRVEKPSKPWLDNVGLLDHAATRVRARDRDPAILEFMRYTNYTFDFSIYVPPLNSITNVARMAGADFALVFTSGIRPFENVETAGPTEKFINNYGPRVHHIAFCTERIESTFERLKSDGVGFLSDLVGGPEEGLHQAFTTTSANTLLVTEYIHRYAGFDGFFTRSNVAQLTEATAKQ